MDEHQSCNGEREAVRAHLEPGNVEDGSFLRLTRGAPSIRQRAEEAYERRRELDRIAREDAEREELRRQGENLSLLLLRVLGVDASHLGLMGYGPVWIDGLLFEARRPNPSTPAYLEVGLPCPLASCGKPNWRPVQNVEGLGRVLAEGFVACGSCGTPMDGAARLQGEVA